MLMRCPDGPVRDWPALNAYAATPGADIDVDDTLVDDATSAGWTPAPKAKQPKTQEASE